MPGTQQASKWQWCFGATEFTGIRQASCLPAAPSLVGRIQHIDRPPELRETREVYIKKIRKKNISLLK